MDDENATAARLRELEIKITYLDDYVAKQNGAIVELSRNVEKLTRALRSLSEKTESLEAAGGNVPPANEKPPHW